MALQNSNIYSIDSYLKYKYYIPNYQREYSWEESELDDFWDDLEATIKNANSNAENDDVHFFGQIVIHNDTRNQKKYIIDGQQRTITSIIFLRTLQLAFLKIYNEFGIEEANQYNSDISSSYMYSFGSYNLTLGDSDNNYFQDNIQKGTLENCKQDKVKAHERMRKAFQKFSEKIDNILETKQTCQEKMETLIELFDAFTKRFIVLCMEATELSEAFIIFETLNARGKDLETADLLKNFIFSRSNDVDLAQKRWNDMLESLDKADTTKFIRHYWNSCHSFTREKELYKKINKEASSPKNSGDLLTSLENLAPYYHDLSNPTDGMNGFESDNICKELITLKTLKASTYYPVVLAMLQKENLKDEKQIEKVLNEIVIYVFRNFTICNKVANTAEVFFAKTAYDIVEEVLTTSDAIVDTIKKDIVDDEEFVSSFNQWVGSNSSKDIIRYILRNVHSYLDSYKEMKEDNTSIHIEHIMPQDNSVWNVDEEIHEANLWKLGNLALLSGPKNIAGSNKPFDEKKKIYASSEIAPNKELCNYETWGEPQIKERQEKLAEYARIIWKK